MFPIWKFLLWYENSKFQICDSASESYSKYFIKAVIWAVSLLAWRFIAVDRAAISTVKNLISNLISQFKKFLKSEEKDIHM